MTYIEKLYSFKKIAFDRIMEREKVGFYLINGYSYKYDDIMQLEKIQFMIDKWNISNKMIWNDITAHMKDDTSIFNEKKLSFRNFVEKIKIENLLVNQNKAIDAKNKI
jgi:hypothetical protein